MSGPGRPPPGPSLKRSLRLRPGSAYPPAETILLAALARIDASGAPADRVLRAALQANPQLDNPARQRIARGVLGLRCWDRRLAYQLRQVGLPMTARLRFGLYARWQLGEPAEVVAARLKLRPAEARGIEAALAWERWPDDPTARLSLRYSLPPWIAAAWITELGEPAAARLAAALNAPGPVTIRVNPELPGLDLAEGRGAGPERCQAAAPAPAVGAEGPGGPGAGLSGGAGAPGGAGAGLSGEAGAPGGAGAGLSVGAGAGLSGGAAGPGGAGVVPGGAGGGASGRGPGGLGVVPAGAGAGARGRGPGGLGSAVEAAARARLGAALQARGVEVAACAWAPLGLRLRSRADIRGDPLYQAGAYEVQDEGSQLIAAAVDARPGQRGLDLCAGAGGKSFALLAAMAGKGELWASDVDPQRLHDLRTRQRRLAAPGLRIVALPPDGALPPELPCDLDFVLVDAPCSALGTWRRGPDRRWHARPEAVAALAALQRRLLARGAGQLRPGGRLVYATCTLLRAENEDVVRAVVAANPQLRPVPPLPQLSSATTLLLRPDLHGTDGFFIAALQLRG